MLVWLDGAVVDAERARVSVFDRGFLFGEGVYESIRCFEGTPFAIAEHRSRLARSLRGIGGDPRVAERLGEICGELLAANRLCDAMVYLQVTRGGVLGKRSHVHDPAASEPTLFGFAWPAPPIAACREPSAIEGVLRRDERWGRCDLKSTNLLANALAAEEARAAGASEAILHRGGRVTEGASSNLFAVIDGALATPPLGGDHPILAGVMRGLAIGEWRRGGGEVAEVAPSVEQLRWAEEVFITSSSRLLSAVVAIDGVPVGSGRPGPVAQHALDLMIAAVRERIAAAASHAMPESTP